MLHTASQLHCKALMELMSINEEANECRQTWCYLLLPSKVSIRLSKSLWESRVFINLETKDIRVANIRANLTQLKYDQEFSEVRAMLSPINKPSETELERTALLWSSRHADKGRGSFVDLQTNKVERIFVAPNPNDSMNWTSPALIDIANENVLMCRRIQRCT